MLTKASDQGLIKGDFVEEIEDHRTHVQLVDDTSVVAKAFVGCIQNVLGIFRVLGQASSLFIKEQGLHVVWVSKRPLSAEFRVLDWVWEDEDSLTKLLGFYIRTEISPEWMVQHLTIVLENRLWNARKAHHSLIMRVTIANQLVSCALMYMLRVWPGDMGQLDLFDSAIRDFIWSRLDTNKHPRVDKVTITLPKDQGGMALISVKTQTLAMARKDLLWVVQEGEHTL